MFEDVYDSIERLPDRNRTAHTSDRAGCSPARVAVRTAAASVRPPARCRIPGTDGNEPGTGSVVLAGRSRIVCVRVICTLAENDVAGAPLQGSGESRVENRPGYRIVRTRIQPL